MVSNWRLRATLSAVDKRRSDTLGEVPYEKQNIAKCSPDVNNCLTLQEAYAHGWIHHHGSPSPRGLGKGRTGLPFMGDMLERNEKPQESWKLLSSFEGNAASLHEFHLRTGECRQP